MKFSTIIGEMSSQGDWPNLYQPLFGHTTSPSPFPSLQCGFRFWVFLCEEIEALDCEESVFMCICINFVDMVKYRIMYLY